MRKLTKNLTPDDVKAMPLDEFEGRFGFRPLDALEKYGWAMLAERISPHTRQAMRAGIIPTPDLSNIVMT